MFEAERIERLRLKTFTANYCLDEIKYRFFKAHGKGAITYDSYAEAYEKAFDSVSVLIDPDELIVGRFGCSLQGEEQKEWEQEYFQYTEEL